MIEENHEEKYLVFQLRPQVYGLISSSSIIEMIESQDDQQVLLIETKDLFVFDEDNENRNSKSIVVVKSAGCKAGLVVDGPFERKQIMITNFSKLSKKIKGIAGGTILSDGAVGLIIDVDQVVMKAINMGIKKLKGGE